MIQPSLFTEAKNRHAREWEAFRANHPHVWEKIVRLGQAKATRGMRFGMKQIFEILRWGESFQGGTPYKLNSNWTAYAARDLVKDYPSYRPLIELREVQS